MIVSSTSEIWTDVYGYEGLYQVSTEGNVRSLDRTTVTKNGREMKFEGKTLKFKTDKDGYKQVSLSKEGKQKSFQVHRLVMINFLPHPNANNLTINHENGQKDDNRLVNLTYMTQIQNMKHAVENGLMKTGENHHKATLTNEQVKYIRSVYVPKHPEFGQGALSRKFGVSQPTISQIVNNKNRVSEKTLELPTMIITPNIAESQDFDA